MSDRPINPFEADLVTFTPPLDLERLTRWIAERARGSGTSGNYTKWREVATAHHITLVQRQLATALAASGRP